MKKKIQEIDVELMDIIETPVKSELDELRELHAKLTELGINRIGQLETKIAELSK